MTPMGITSLEDFSNLLASSGYDVAFRTFSASQSVVIAESPYALVCCCEVSDWNDLSRLVSDVQAELTQLAAGAPSARRWDLYLVIHMLIRPPGPAEEAIGEAIEADTRYARKFVRVAISSDDPGALEKALRPLLPLHPAPEFDLVEPLEALRAELYDLDISHEVVDAALTSFSQDDEVMVP
jgi:hypothetical protein